MLVYCLKNNLDEGSLYLFLDKYKKSLIRSLNVLLCRLIILNK
jgi:hypothetical protein